MKLDSNGLWGRQRIMEKLLEITILGLDFPETNMMAINWRKSIQETALLASFHLHLWLFSLEQTPEQLVGTSEKDWLLLSDYVVSICIADWFLLKQTLEQLVCNLQNRSCLLISLRQYQIKEAKFQGDTRELRRGRDMRRAPATRN